MADFEFPWGFDPVQYVKCNPDVAAEGADAYKHWIEYGRHEEWRGDRRNWRAPDFDGRAYLANYPDVLDAIETGEIVSAAEHWFVHGRAEVAAGTRAMFPGFDENRYLEQRGDVAAAVAQGQYTSGFDHWLQIGRYEERSAFARPHMPSRGTNRIGTLSEEKQRFWRENGFVILEGVVPPERCDAVNERINRAWVERKTSEVPISIDTFIERSDTRRVAMRHAPAAARSLPYKINDMVMLDETVRGVALDDTVCDALRWVLDADPVAISSLNFERGSTQRFHTDTLYMPGLEPGGMTAAWFALEDVTTEAGPLLYYPGSHRIPMFNFSSGKSYQIAAEVPEYDEHMNAGVASLGLDMAEFLPKKGDVLIWHEKLYHAGKAIEDLAQTRKSLVVHYWRASALPEDQLIRAHGGFYLDRPPLAVAPPADVAG